MPYGVTIEVMLNERPAETDAKMEAARWKRGDIVAVYKRKPDGTPGMPRTVYIHVDDIPDAVSLTALRYTLCNDFDWTTDENGDEYRTSRGVNKIVDARVPGWFWSRLNRDRVLTGTWAQLIGYLESERSGSGLTEQDFTEGPQD